MQRRKAKTGRGRLTLWIGCAMLGVLALSALLAPVICRFDPLEQDLYSFLLPPGGETLLEYVNGFLEKERGSGRMDELGDIYLRGRRP